jgi:hypothetical protein
MSEMPVAGIVSAFGALWGGSVCTVAYLFYQRGKQVGYAEGLKFKNWFQGRASEGEQAQSAGQLGGIGRAQTAWWQNALGAQNIQGLNQQKLQQQMQAVINQLNNLKP